MERTRIEEGVRQMRFESLLGRQEGGEITQAEAAELLGVKERTFRRWRDRYREEGEAGLADRRPGRRSPRRGPPSGDGRVLGPFRGKYSEFLVKHFHKQLGKRHSSKIEYDATKGQL